MDDTLLLALLLKSQPSSVSDEEYKDVFRDKEIKAAMLRTIAFLLIISLVFLSLSVLCEEHIILNLLLLLPGGYALILLPFALYFYLKAVIVQWLKL